VNAAVKVMELGALIERIAPLRMSGNTVALANGLFDILHVGHLRYLEGASLEGDLLIVAINSDESARRLKGPSRPVVPERERAELVAGFSCVDHALLFAEDNVERVLHELRPDVHCKGTDYTNETVPEREVAVSLGIRIAIVGDPKRHATRDLIRQIRDED